MPPSVAGSAGAMVFLLGRFWRMCEERRIAQRSSLIGAPALPLALSRRRRDFFDMAPRDWTRLLRPISVLPVGKTGKMGAGRPRNPASTSERPWGGEVETRPRGPSERPHSLNAIRHRPYV
jgi:hypothetical protein